MTTGIGLVHGLLWWRRRTPDQGLFALGSGGLGLATAIDALLFVGLMEPNWAQERLGMLFRNGAYGAMVLFAAAFFRWPERRVPHVAVASLLVCGAMKAFQPTGLVYSLTYVGYGVAVLAGAAFVVQGLRTGVIGARLLFVGFSPLLLWGAGDALAAATEMPAGWHRLRPWLALGSVGGLTATMSVVLANRFADTLDELDETWRAAARFVPTAFLGLLGRNKIIEVRRGDCVSLTMAVMFCDIRGFTTMSEARSPARNFRFINQFLETMEPCIHDNGGFVGQYLGDGFLALFPAGRSDPVAAAVAMQGALPAFNRAQLALGEPGIRIGIGLHCGTVMLGTIGGAERLDTGVVSDVVNTASRVEGLSKLYGAPVVVSEATLALAAEGVEVQELDAVVVKGRLAPMRVYEVIDGEPEVDRRARKRDGAERYARGLAAFRAGDIGSARTWFADLAAEIPAAALFVERCDFFLENGLPADWDGVIRLTVK